MKKEFNKISNVDLSSFIPVSEWKLYHTDDIGPLYYVGRYNGGCYAFKYIEKENNLIVTRRGLGSPIAYTNIKEKGKRKEFYGFFYRINIDNKEYYIGTLEAKKYFPNGLPAMYIDYNEKNQENDLDVIDADFIEVESDDIER